MTNRASHLFRWAAETPEATALVFGDEWLTFAWLADRVRETAGALLRLGVQQGDHVGIMLPSSPDFIIVQQALFAIGAVITPVNVMYRLGEVRHAIDACRLSSIVSTVDLISALGGELDCAVMLMDGPTADDHSFSISEALLQSAPLRELAAVDDTDLAMLLLTSATTGKAKGVMLTAGNLAANYDRTPAWLGVSNDSIILCALPLYNTFGLNQCINAMLVTGCRMVLVPRFDAERCITAIAEERCTFLPAVPTMLQKIVDHPAAGDNALISLRTVMTGGAPVPSALLSRLLTLAPDVELLTGYGLTEATALVTLTRVQLLPSGSIDRARTIGRVLDGMELAILGDGDDVQPTGCTGEIVVRGPNVMAGYYEAPADTAEAIRGEWLRTGDVGFLDDERYAFIVDRKKDVIIRGGQNIYPADIEEVLYQVAGVAEAAVVAVPDSLLGEVPAAFISTIDGASLDEAALLAHCRAQLASYKLPVSVTILDQLPKGPTGKILRRSLRVLADAA